MNDVNSWLHSLGLGEYAPAFAEHGIESDLLPELTDADLQTLGVAALGHRKRLLKAVAALNGAAAPGSAVAPSVAPAPAPTPAAASVSPTPLAERRQLTVMFCDLVGSTALSGRLDPEDLRQLMRRYGEAVSAAVAPFGGQVARFLGDGVLVYFGYPRAHEDDAARAVRAGLRAIAVVDALQPDTRLQVRIGIATGLVVVGEIAAGTPAAEQTASGETPNLAARLQALAEPGQIVLSEYTRRLLGASFELDSLGPVELKGFALPITAWRVRAERALGTRFEAQHEHALTPFIGRDAELALLLERWALAREGEAQVVLLIGEAGIGKSRIAQSLRTRLAGDAIATVLLQCSPYFTSSALYPVVQHLERTCGMQRTDSPAQRAARLQALTAGLGDTPLGCLLRLMGLPDGGRALPGGASPQEEKLQTLQALLESLQRLAHQQPVLFLVEDAHWIDPTTEELIRRAADRLRQARVLMLITARPEYVTAWSGLAQLTRLSLGPLSQRQCATLVHTVAGEKALPAEVVAEILRKTDGIPLFVEELTKTVLDSGLLQDSPEGWQLAGQLSALAIPLTLQDSLMARLDRLASAKEVAQVGAVIGREFSQALLAQALVDRTPAQLEQALSNLVGAELVYRNGTPPQVLYSFKHALVRDTAYQSMLKSQRALRHGQIAAAIERSQPDIVTTQPELLGYHWQEAGNPASALTYWRAAGDQAITRSAAQEAVAHYQAAITLFPKGDTGRDREEAELQLQLKLGIASLQSQGYSSRLARDSWQRASELALSLDRIDEYGQALGALADSLFTQCRLGDSLALLDRITPDQLARMTPMSRVAWLAHKAYAEQLCGSFDESWSHINPALRELRTVPLVELRPIAGANPGVLGRHWAAQVRVIQGFFEQSHGFAMETMPFADPSEQAYSRAVALSVVGRSMGFKGQVTDAVACLQQAREIAERHGVKSYGALVGIYLGIHATASGDVAGGLRMMRDGVAQWKANAGRFNSSALVARAAQALLDVGHREGALEFIVDGEATCTETEEKWYEADLLRLRGRLAELNGDRGEAELKYRQAIATAEPQGAKAFSLTAATALARLLQSQGRFEEADTALRPIYEWFTEGFDWPDLKRAKAVLYRAQ